MAIRTWRIFLIENVQVAQNSLGAGQTVNGQPLMVGQGLTASTSILNTGFGFNYFPYFHIGATAWYLMGLKGTIRCSLASIPSPGATGSHPSVGELTWESGYLRRNTVPPRGTARPLVILRRMHFSRTPSS